MNYIYITYIYIYILYIRETIVCHCVYVLHNNKIHLHILYLYTYTFKIWRVYLILLKSLGRETDFFAPSEKSADESHSFSMWQPSSLFSCHHLQYKGLCA